MLRSIVKRSIRRLGFDIRGYHPAGSDDARFMAMLSAHNVNLVFDVGANVGQFGQLLRDAGFRGSIVSFEPLSMAREMLQKASREDPNWTIAPCSAIGGEDGEITIQISGTLASSSIRNMLDAHLKASPRSGYIDSQKVPLRRLDSFESEYVLPDSVLFIKVDTQGYEDQVLNGASCLLEKAVGIQMELSLVPLYEGQCLYDEMMDRMKTMGFELWG